MLKKRIKNNCELSIETTLPLTTGLIDFEENSQRS